MTDAPSRRLSIARLVDPDAFETAWQHSDWSILRRAEALLKADAILATDGQAAAENCRWPACVTGEAAGKRCGECPHHPARYLLGELVEATQALIGQLEHALTGMNDPDGLPFIAGKSEVDLQPDGSYRLSQARTAHAKAKDWLEGR